MQFVKILLPIHLLLEASGPPGTAYITSSEPVIVIVSREVKSLKVLAPTVVKPLKETSVMPKFLNFGITDVMSVIVPGTVSSESEQPSKASSAIVFTEVLNSQLMSVMPVFAKALLPIVVTILGKLANDADVRAVPSKARSGIVLGPLAPHHVTDERPEHSAKALLDNVVTEERFTELRPVQPVNAYLPILVTLLKLIVEIEEFVNAPFPIVRKPVAVNVVIEEPLNAPCALAYGCVPVIVPAEIVVMVDGNVRLEIFAFPLNAELEMLDPIVSPFTIFVGIEGVNEAVILEFCIKP